MTWYLAQDEVAQLVAKTPATTKVWLHRHGIKAARRVSVGERATRAMYDGDQVQDHAAAGVVTCTACTSARRRRGA